MEERGDPEQDWTDIFASKVFVFLFFFFHKKAEGNSSKVHERCSSDERGFSLK